MRCRALGALAALAAVAGCGSRPLEGPPVAEPPPGESTPDADAEVTPADAAAVGRDAPADTAQPIGAIRTGVAIPQCGGNDAPSMAILVAPPGAPALSCAPNPPERGNFDEVWPWRPLTVGMLPLSIPGTGAASSCTADGCTDAVSASLTITTLSSTTAAGSYAMTLPDGGSRSASFVVTVCVQPFGPCG